MRTVLREDKVKRRHGEGMNTFQRLIAGAAQSFFVGAYHYMAARTDGRHRVALMNVQGLKEIAAFRRDGKISSNCPLLSDDAAEASFEQVTCDENAGVQVPRFQLRS
jgi:hypothetical protein